MFPSPWYLRDVTYGARMGRPLSLCRQSPECKLCKWRLFHHCQSNTCGPDLLPLKVEEKVIHMKVILSLRRMTYFLQIFMGFLLEQSQHESGMLSDSWTWQQWACWGMRPQPSPLWSICPQSSSHHCLFQPPLGDTVRPWRPWCKPGPMSACLWGRRGMMQMFH